MQNNTDNNTDALASKSETCHERDGLFVRYQDYYHKIPYADILYVEAVGCYCDIHLYVEAVGCYCDIHLRGRSTPITVVKRLAEFEEFLPEHLFVRVHRSHIVSLRAVTKFVGNIVWLGNLSLPIGEKYRNGFLSRLDIL